MDAFQALIAKLLQRRGFWVHQSYQVEFNEEDKAAIGRTTLPRWNINIVAYKRETNHVTVVRCKPELDTAGIKSNDFSEEGRITPKFRIFNDPEFREILLQRLVQQLEDIGLCAKNPAVTLCLATGNIASEQDRIDLKAHFNKNEWLLLDKHWIINELKEVSKGRYEDEMFVIVSKLLLR